MYVSASFRQDAVCLIRSLYVLRALVVRARPLLPADQTTTTLNERVSRAILGEIRLGPRPHPPPPPPLQPIIEVYKKNCYFDK